MTTNLSPVDVCNQALSQAGVRAQITSVFPSDGTAAGDACALLYQSKIDAFSRAAHWNCLRFASGQQSSTQPPPLSLLKAAAGTPENVNGTTLPIPPLPWLYEYALPADCLKARQLIPQVAQSPSSVPLTTGTSMVLPTMSAMGAPRFEVGVDLDASGNEVAVLLTNLGSANFGPPVLIYTRRLKNIGLWDSQFFQGAVAALAVWLSPALKGSAALFQLNMGVAKAMLDAARVSDGNEGPQTQDHTPDWIAVRSGGRVAGSALFIAPWEPFGFPGGGAY